jgi:hypothetical protein
MHYRGDFEQSGERFCRLMLFTYSNAGDHGPSSRTGWMRGRGDGPQISRLPRSAIATVGPGSSRDFDSV